MLFGAINLKTAHRVVLTAHHAGGTAVRAFLRELTRRYRRAGTIWLLADRASGHTASATQALAPRLGIEFLWLPKQAPELNAMDQLWRELKREVAANRQAPTIDVLAAQASEWVLDLSPTEARRKAGMLSKHHWLKNLSQSFWLPIEAITYVSPDREKALWQRVPPAVMKEPRRLLQTGSTPRLKVPANN